MGLELRLPTPSGKPSNCPAQAALTPHIPHGVIHTAAELLWLLVCRLDALRAQRLRSDPKEEKALLDSARALTAAAKPGTGEAPAVKSDAGAADPKPDEAAAISSGVDGGRGRGSGRARGRGRATK